MKKTGIFTLLYMACALTAHAQMEVHTEAQLTTSDGQHTPLWLNANKYGLSSLDKTNGYVRAGLFQPLGNDTTRQWDWGFGADVAVASGFTSTVVVQQAYGQLRWKKGVLTLGSKEQPMELRNQQLSSGVQTLGINARPFPSLRLALPSYYEIPWLRQWVAVKGHLAFGMQTDDHWQEDFTSRQTKYTRHSRVHTKAGYLRLGKADKPLNVELGLEMACQYGGKSYVYDGQQMAEIKNSGGLKGLWHALIPSGYEANEEDVIYKNADGNHLGSWVMRANLDYQDWGVSVYADHFFEDHSSMFFLDYDGYGTGEDWDKKKHFQWFVYDLRDMQLGVELRLKKQKWVNCLVAEYIYTKYQSGPIYHDHTQSMPDHVSGKDNYYNHSVFTGWQHWGQVAGNPLYRSPLYNRDGVVMVENNRFAAWHVAVGGAPAKGLTYRLMCSWQDGLGTYEKPLTDPQHNLSALAEAQYEFGSESRLAGWRLKAAFGYDHGKLLGNNTGMQFTVARRFAIKK